MIATKLGLQFRWLFQLSMHS